MIIQNPILTGFNPDPSIVRVGEDYYIATSTFEWFPGVQIHHSKDLVNWELVKRPLERKSQLDMLGVPDSCGVWAPCLTYDKGTFYLIYTNVKTFDSAWKDTLNYLATADDILGEWSDPVFLDSRGFDASLFHDEDGRKWYLSMVVDHRKGKFFGGIILQEYDVEAKRLIGDSHLIFEGTALGKTEGPHLYKKDGFYYLLTAEGGTEYGHAMTIARSKNITGPYTLHPNNPLVTCRNSPEHPLQKSGHGDIVQAENGDWHTTFLVGRPLTTLGRCTLGRETAIEKLTWEEGEWPQLTHGSALPRAEFEINETDQPAKSIAASHFDDFDTESLNIHFQSLRVPMGEWCSLNERSGHLRLKGRESLSSLHDQSMIARRVQHFDIETSTVVDFQPTYFQQAAGLIFYYNTTHFHYLYITCDDEKNRQLRMLTCDKGIYEEHENAIIDLPPSGQVFLKGTFQKDTIQYYYATEKDQWNKIGNALDGSILSDDYVQDDHGKYRAAFTGSFVGMCCQDLTGQGNHADFDWFSYKVLD